MPSRLSGSVRRVLMTADAVGGVWTYAVDLARGISRHGVATTLAVLGRAPSEAQRRDAERVCDLDLIETGLPLDWLCDDPRAQRSAAEALAVLAAEAEADVVQLNGCALASEADYPAPVLAVHHSCLATWWASVGEGPLPAEWRWRADLARRHLASADLVVAPTAAFAARIATTYGLAVPPPAVHNGRSRPGTNPLGRSLDAVFTAGRLWDEGKNIGTLDRAAARIDAPSFAAGPTLGPRGARAEANHLRLLGELTAEEVRIWLARRPIFVSGAIYEPFGLAVLEAAQAGCALVLSDIPTFRELWEDAALFAPARDPRAFADAASALLRDPALRSRMERAARERAQLYSLEAAARHVTALYAEMQDRPRTRAAERAA